MFPVMEDCWVKCSNAQGAYFEGNLGVGHRKYNQSFFQAVAGNEMFCNAEITINWHAVVTKLALYFTVTAVTAGLRAVLVTGESGLAVPITGNGLIALT